MVKQYLETGIIAGTHGVRGELRVNPWSDSPDTFRKVKTLYFDEGKTPVKVLSARPHKNQVLLTLEGVDTVEKADTLRGKVLYLDRADLKLPKGTVFLQDLMGLQAVDGSTGRVYGVLEEIIPTGANDVYRIRDEKGKDYLFPAVAHMIQEIAVEEGKIYLLPIPGIFDEDYERGEET
jgi:16S rRNA processing protein RimM